MSQRDEVLRLLKDAGDRGVHTAELRRAFIGNPSQRIIELEDRGHSIRATREKSPFGPSMGARYVLVSHAASGVASTPTANSSGADWKTTEASPDALFDLTAGSPFSPWAA